MNDPVLVGVSLLCDQFTNRELSQIFLLVTGGYDMRSHPAYVKCPTLFQSDGTMHLRTMEAFGQIVSQRLQAEGDS